MSAGEKLTRRPIRVRNTKWAAAISQLLIRIGLRPNTISILSVVCAAIAGLSLLYLGRSESPGSQIALLVVAAVFIQMRLLCNLFDGMVAVEGGFRSKSGEIFNELPDRISDGMILASAGYAAVWPHWSAELGWAAAALAITTAYVRTLGAQAGASQQFGGPMAKQQRMFLITIACLVMILETINGWPYRIMGIALIMICAGCVITILRRTVAIVTELEQR